MILTFKKILGFLFFSSLLFLALPQNSQAIRISPPILEIEADPGQTVTGLYEVTNTEDSERTFYLSFRNFEAQGESGVPTFTDSESGLASWMSGGTQVVLRSGETKKLSFTTSVPNNADAGGHYGAVFVSTKPAGVDVSGNRVNINEAVPVLVLLDVSGFIETSGELLEYGLVEEGNFHSSLPVDFMYRLQNNGNDRLKPDSELIIKNQFGKTVEVLDANPTNGNALGRTVRRYEVSWSKTGGEEPKGFFKKAAFEWRNYAFGIYTATLSIPFERYSDLQEVEESVKFTVVPWRLFILIIFGGLLIFFVLANLIKRYNQWLIRKVMNSQTQNNIQETEQ